MAESVEEQETRTVLQISGFVNGYGPTIGLQQFDYILGVDGTPFLGTAKQFNALFAYEDEEDAAAHVDETWILTVKRDQTAFNISVTQSLGAKFDEVDADAHPLSENDLVMLRAATRSGLIEYMVFHDMQKNAELVDRSKSLLAMVCPPFWFLNRRMPEAALASILAFFVALTVHWILGVVFYLMLCIYSGREQGNMLIAFMSFRKFIYLQTIVAENELSAQRTVLSLDSEMFFKAPVAGLEQPRRRKKKRPPVGV